MPVRKSDKRRRQRAQDIAHTNGGGGRPHHVAGSNGRGAITASFILPRILRFHLAV